MPFVEDAQLDDLQKADKLLRDLMQGPTRTHLLSLIKAKHPTAAIPELDAAKPVYDQMRQLKAELEDIKAERDRYRADQAFAEQFRTSLKGIQVTDDGEKAIKQLMVDRGIADPRAAALLYQDMNPPPEPVAPLGYRGTDFIDHSDPDIQKWIENEDLMADQEIGNVMTEIRRGTLRA